MHVRTASISRLSGARPHGQSSPPATPKAHPPARGGSLGPRGAPSPLRHRRGAAAAAARPKSPGFHWASATHARLVCSLHALYSPTNYTHSTYYGRPGEAAFRHRFLGRAAHSFVIGAPGHARAFVGFTLVPLRTRTQPVLQVSRAPGGTCTCRLPPTRCAYAVLVPCMCALHVLHMHMPTRCRRSCSALPRLTTRNPTQAPRRCSLRRCARRDARARTCAGSLPKPVAPPPSPPRPTPRP